MSKEKLLKFEPRPLLDPNTKIALLWSAKAGSAFSVKWFFAQSNLLHAAYFYHGWVHKFREEVFYNSKRYIEAQVAFKKEDYLCIKVVRSPFSRVVSSYIHALKYGYENDGLRVFLGRDITESSGFSFYEFVSYLYTIDISRCNNHHREQLHPIEINGLLVPNHVIKLEDSMNEIKSLEEKYKLKRTPVETFRDSPHNTQRRSGNEFCGMVQYSPSDEEFFNYRHFYNNELVNKVLLIYENDFKAYEYSEKFD
jgi:hypothetical protein